MKGPKVPLIFFCFLQYKQLLARSHNPLVSGSSPGGPTMKIMDLGELWREAKGLESLGAGVGEERAPAIKQVLYIAAGSSQGVQGRRFPSEPQRGTPPTKGTGSFYFNLASLAALTNSKQVLRDDKTDDCDAGGRADRPGGRDGR
jgi:hypothetical protein